MWAWPRQFDEQILDLGNTDQKLGRCQRVVGKRNRAAFVVDDSQVRRSWRPLWSSPLPHFTELVSERMRKRPEPLRTRPQAAR